MIETDNLTRRFGDSVAVDSLTLSVKEGEVFGFLGPNGAGKTTTVRMLTCLISKTSGRATVDGYEVGKRADLTSIRNTVGVLPETVGFYDDLSVYKNLDFYGRLYECTESQRRARIERLLTVVGLWDRRDEAVGGFSKGMRQKVAIARALLHDPKVVFLDEPTANLDPESAKSIRDHILQLKREGRTIFLNTHNLDEAEKVCDRVGILKTRLLALGPLDQMKRGLFERRTVVKLGAVTDSVLSSITKAGFTGFQVEGDEVRIAVRDPEVDNPVIVDSIVAAGGKVRSVQDVGPTLEDAYLSLVRGDGG